MMCEPEDDAVGRGGAVREFEINCVSVFVRVCTGLSLRVSVFVCFNRYKRVLSDAQPEET